MLVSGAQDLGPKGSDPHSPVPQPSPTGGVISPVAVTAPGHGGTSLSVKEQRSKGRCGAGWTLSSMRS